MSQLAALDYYLAGRNEHKLLDLPSLQPSEGARWAIADVTFRKQTKNMATSFYLFPPSYSILEEQSDT